MNNNCLLKIYLITACTAVVLFLGSFAIGWHYFTSMAQIYFTTIPFLITAIAALTAFGLSPAQGQQKAASKPARVKNNVVLLKQYTRRYNSCYALRKIS